MTVIELIDRECENIKQLLIAKNKAYGNSFQEPINIFSFIMPPSRPHCYQICSFIPLAFSMIIASGFNSLIRASSSSGVKVFIFLDQN